ncbi:hypothetical protein [Weissella tructae]|nr:hypothetical protein [Weissella tructae]QVV90856.1 hypothetical protein KHQ32_04275 [Weissella tructae]
MKDMQANMEFENMSELKKLTNLAVEQANQLEETLQLINDFKILGKVVG